MKFEKKNLNIGYFGDGNWAYQNLIKIFKDKTISTKFICLRKKPDNRIKILSKKKKIPCFKFENVNDKSSIKKITSYKCDYLISMSYDQIFGKKILTLMKNKIINCHAGLLPFYRGRNVLNWALVNDEKFFGVTTHLINEKIDQGNIIKQIKIKISKFDTYRTLLKKAEKNCSILLYSTIKIIQKQKGNFATISQKNINQKGSYFRKRNSQDEEINWSKSAKEIYNLIRGISSPGPNSKTIYNNKILRIKKSKIIKLKTKKIFKKGEIILKTKNYFVVNTGFGRIKILDWYPKLSLKAGQVFS